MLSYQLGLRVGGNLYALDAKTRTWANENYGTKYQDCLCLVTNPDYT